MTDGIAHPTPRSMTDGFTYPTPQPLSTLDVLLRNIRMALTSGVHDEEVVHPRPAILVPERLAHRVRRSIARRRSSRSSPG